MTSSKTTSGTALQTLIRANFKELLRDSRSLISMSVFFVVTVLVLIALQAMINGGGSTPRLLLTDTVESKITDQLDAANGIETSNEASGDAAAANAELTREGSGAGYTVVISSEDRPDWLRIVEALESAGVPHSEITVVDDEGSPQIDFLRQNLSLALLTGYAAIAFVGTSRAPRPHAGRHDDAGYDTRQGPRYPHRPRTTTHPDVPCGDDDRVGDRLLQRVHARRTGHD